MTNWQFYPRSVNVTQDLNGVIEVFQRKCNLIDSRNHSMNSNEVLELVREDLESIGFKVERSRAREDKIVVPVLFGRNGEIEKYFEADGYNEKTQTVIEVEAGRAYSNHQFLKDLFQASVMSDVEYLVIAVRNTYRGSNDFDKITAFMDTLYASTRLSIPLRGVLIIGY